ncbi:hypothetical protein Tco_1563171 [Tanacetum coccineum]
MPWGLYESEILSRFGDVYDDPMVELIILKLNGDVQAYQNKFEMLLNKVDLIESQAVSFFVGRLKNEISLPLRMFKPTTMKDVTCLAKMQEATIDLTKTKRQYLTFINSKYTPGHKCSGQLYTLEVMVNEEEDSGVAEVDGNMVEEVTQETKEEESIPKPTFSTAKKLTIVPLEVSVANGNQMISKYMCNGLQWTLQGIPYTTDVIGLPLGSYDMVFRV